MGAAWRDLHGRKSGFKRILQMVTEIRGMGMEVCTTLGMLDADQARQLKEAGLTAYNHNLDTSREFYPKVRWALQVPEGSQVDHSYRSSLRGLTLNDWKPLKTCEWLASAFAQAASLAWARRRKIASA
jgi:hypothetical protein